MGEGINNRPRTSEQPRGSASAKGCLNASRANSGTLAFVRRARQPTIGFRYGIRTTFLSRPGPRMADFCYRDSIRTCRCIYWRRHVILNMPHALNLKTMQIPFVVPFSVCSVLVNLIVDASKSSSCIFSLMGKWIQWVPRHFCLWVRPGIWVPWPLAVLSTTVLRRMTIPPSLDAWRQS